MWRGDLRASYIRWGGGKPCGDAAEQGRQHCYAALLSHASTNKGVGSVSNLEHGVIHPPIIDYGGHLFPSRLYGEVVVKSTIVVLGMRSLLGSLY